MKRIVIFLGLKAGEFWVEVKTIPRPAVLFIIAYALLHLLMGVRGWIWLWIGLMVAPWVLVICGIITGSGALDSFLRDNWRRAGQIAGRGR